MKFEIRSERGFVIGDPCHVLADEIRDTVKVPADGRIIYSTKDGWAQAIQHKTYSGDGSYKVYDGLGKWTFIIPVDSGSIGIFDLDLLGKQNDSVFVIEGPGTASLDYDSGEFRIQVNEKIYSCDTIEWDERDPLLVPERFVTEDAFDLMRGGLSITEAVLFVIDVIRPNVRDVDKAIILSRILCREISPKTFDTLRKRYSAKLAEIAE